MEEGRPQFSDDFKFFQRCLLTAMMKNPAALDKHGGEGRRQRIGAKDELIDESYIAYKLGVVQIGVEITLN